MVDIEAFYRVLEARDWAAFEALLAPDLVAALPQSNRELRGPAAYRQFNEDYPGDWHIRVVRVHADGAGAAGWIEVRIGAEVSTGLEFFTYAPDGLIGRIDSFWPTEYDAADSPAG